MQFWLLLIPLVTFLMTTSCRGWDVRGFCSFRLHFFSKLLEVNQSDTGGYSTQ